jgi:hypothetical protein
MPSEPARSSHLQVNAQIRKKNWKVAMASDKALILKAS